MGLSFSIEGTVFLVFCVFVIAAVGYLIGRITVKGVNLGTAGVFVAALLFGCFCYPSLADQLSVDGVSYVTDGLKIVENLGLMFFVTAVGFIAGPTFLSNFKKNFKSYVCLGLVIILFGALACVGCILIGRHFTDLADDEFTAILVGLLAGALTSTPVFIIDEVCKFYNIEPATLRGQGRAKDISLARQIAMYLIRSMTNLSLDDIGKQFDNRDHSTVLYSIQQVEKKMKKDAAFAETVKEIKTNINSKR